MSITICPNSADFGDVATWIAGIATVVAVLVALNAAKREREKSIEIQEREWSRADTRMQLRTARLANAFHRDLVYAARELTILIANLNANKFVVLSEAMAEYLVNGRPSMQLHMIDRFAGDLDGFADQDVLALLTALASWRSISGPLAVSIGDLTQERAATMAANIRKTAIFMHKEHAKLNDRMITYFKEMPGLEGEVEDEIPDELRAALEGRKNEAQSEVR